ncbi:MAG: hypothetical protein JKX85_11800 [Phycisphaeraceae bacterium]|nr:hypothetical protein [Phycisphaeraceae bacterium]
MTTIFTLSVMSEIDWIVVAGYAFVVVLLATRFRGDTTDENYYLAGHSIPAWASGMSFLATGFSATWFIGSPQWTFNGDFRPLMLFSGGIVAAVVVAIVLLPIHYRVGTITVYGYIEQRFGVLGRRWVGAWFSLGALIGGGAALYVASIALSSLFFNPQNPATSNQLILIIIGIGLFGTLYTSIGGLCGVIWTDVLQLLVIMGSGLFCVVLLMSAIPLSIPEMINYLRHAPSTPIAPLLEGENINKLRLVDWHWQWADPMTVWAGLIGMTLFNITGFGASQVMGQRLLACRSARDAGAAVIGGYLLAIVIVAMFMFIGLLLFMYSDPRVMGDAAGQFSSSDRAFSEFIVNHLPKGVSGLAVAGILAAVMSSLDSGVSAISSSITGDLGLAGRESQTQNGTRHAARLVTLIVGVCLTTIAVLIAAIHNPGNDALLDFVLSLSSFTGAGILGVFAAGLLTRRGNAHSVGLALLSGAATVFCLQPIITQPMFGVVIAWPWWVGIGSIPAFAVCIVPVGRSSMF